MAKQVVEGLRELDAALGELTKATGRTVMRRAGKAALEPMARAARLAAPVDEGDLRESIDVSTKLTRRQAAQHTKRDEVEVFMGPGGLAQAITQEFGTSDHPAQPFMRPAWDGGQQKLVNDLKFELAFEIDKAAKRAARKAMRNAG